MWLHVDAAMSGIGALVPELRWINDGLELADSYCTNPHKWMGVNFDCDLYWTADRDGAARRAAASCRSTCARRRPSPARRSTTATGRCPLGRRFRALKLWFTLRLDGVESIRRR